MTGSALAKQLRFFAFVILIVGIACSIWRGVSLLDVPSEKTIDKIPELVRKIFEKFFQQQENAGIIILIIGPIASYISFLVLFSIASMLETINLIHSNSYEMRALRDAVVGDSALAYKKAEEESVQKIVIAPPTEGGWICDKCGTRNNKSSLYCKDCGKYK